MIKKIAKFIFLVLILVSTIIILFINMSPQFGSNPSSIEKDYFKTFPNYQEGEFKSLEKTPLMTGEVSAWEFLKMLKTETLKLI